MDLDGKVRRSSIFSSQPTDGMMDINHVCKKGICRFLMLGKVDEHVGRDADRRACTDLYFYELELGKKRRVLSA